MATLERRGVGGLLGAAFVQSTVLCPECPNPGLAVPSIYPELPSASKFTFFFPRNPPRSSARRFRHQRDSLNPSSINAGFFSALLISAGDKCAWWEAASKPREGYVGLSVFSIARTRPKRSDPTRSTAKMTVMDFFGCAFLAFGPPLAMFTFTVAADPMRIIVLIVSAFFWLISLLVSSVLWYTVPLQNHLAFGLVFSVLFQEAFRYLLYWVLRRAERGLEKITTTHVADSRHVFAYVSGLGFGFTSGAFALVNVLADSVGPGTMGLRQGTEYFFIISAATTLCFILLHTFWSVVFFAALDRKNWGQVIWVVSSHLFVSCMTLLNVYQAYVATILSAYVVLMITTTIAFKVVGGRAQSIAHYFARK